MNSRILILVSLLCLSQTCLSNVVKRATEVATPSPADQFLNTLTTIFEQVQTKTTEATKSVLNALGVKDQDELKTNINEKVTTYSKALTDRLNDVSKVAEQHSGNFQKVLNDFVTTVQNEVKKSQGADSTVTKAFEQSQDLMKNVITQVQDVYKNSALPDAVKNTFQQIATETESAAKDLQKSIERKTQA